MLKRKAFTNAILVIVSLKSNVPEKLTGQKGKDGVFESEFGTFRGAELFALKKLLGRDVSWVWNKYPDFLQSSEEEKGAFTSAVESMKSVGKEFHVEGEEKETRYWSFEIRRKSLCNGSMQVVYMEDINPAEPDHKMLIWS